jgi:hypothetical protein
MNNSNKVIIVGAGAHKTYGMPLGKELVDEIRLIYNIFFRNSSNYSFCDNMAQDILFNLKTYTQYSKENQKYIKEIYTSFDLYMKNYFSNIWSGSIQVSEVRNAYNRYIKSINDLIETNPSSIDSYLTGDLNKFEIGAIKSLIIAIINFHQNQISFSDSVEDPWIEKLVEKVIDHTDKSYNPENYFPKIITLNYDTWLEERLKRTMLNQHKKDTITTLLESNIFHFYGKINGSGIPTINRFFNKFDKSAIEAIKTIPDERTGAQPDIKIKQWINNSSDLLLLGYGFDPLNSKRLFDERETKAEKTIYSNNHDFFESVTRKYSKNYLDNFQLNLSFFEKGRPLTSIINEFID